MDEERIVADTESDRGNLTATDNVVQAAKITETSQNLEITNVSTSPPLSTNLWDGLVTDPLDVMIFT